MTTIVTRFSLAALLVWSGNALHAGAVRAHALRKQLDAWLANRERAAKDRVALSHMSDRELHDIGISRASIGPAANGSWLRDY